MKKLLIILLSALSLITFAQKQVAMLEPLVVAGNVKPIEKSMIRGEMTKAIASQSGYSAFSRTDIDQIMVEQKFQQSGMVDDATRKRIGAMQGVDYVCITKITKEGNAYYLEANLLNIESGQISSPATQYGELDGNGGFANMRNVCVALACDLIGIPVSMTGINTHSSSDDAATLYQKGIDYVCGDNGVTIDIPLGVKYIQQAAEKGFAAAQYFIGELYLYGEFRGADVGFSEDPYTAVKWFRKAAEQGFAFAQYMLGSRYFYGDGVVQDYYAAVCWYRKAAEQGHDEAQYQMGICYYNGLGVTKDYDVAIKWFRKAAEQGITRAQCRLGECYFYGHGVSKDYYYAVNLFRNAAEKGYDDAQNYLGMSYFRGNGVTQDYVTAIKWFRKAAAQGNASAQFNLAYCYEFGCGVNKDIKTAKSWYNKALEQGDKSAAEALDRLEREEQERLAELHETRKATLLAQVFVDLGLPSGTLWKNQNEGGDNARYTYDEAVRKFGNKLPTKQQMEELKNKCTWTWMGNGYKVTGPNGKSITLPAAGHRDCDGGVYYVGTIGNYWLSTPYDSDNAGSLYFYSSGVVNMLGYYRCFGLSVRLVHNL